MAGPSTLRGQVESSLRGSGLPGTRQGPALCAPGPVVMHTFGFAPPARNYRVRDDLETFASLIFFTSRSC
jgi:hypothetical protein